MSFTFTSTRYNLCDNFSHFLNHCFWMWQICWCIWYDPHFQEEHHPLPKEHNKSAPRPNKKSSFNIKQFFERAVPNDLSDFVRSRMTSMAIDPSGYSCMYQMNWQIQATNVKILSTYMYMYIYTICKCIVNSVYAFIIVNVQRQTLSSLIYSDDRWWRTLQ